MAENRGETSKSAAFTDGEKAEHRIDGSGSRRRTTRHTFPWLMAAARWLRLTCPNCGSWNVGLSGSCFDCIRAASAALYAKPTVRRRRSFLICPVRGHDPAKFAETVARLEAAGFDVHWPPRDTDQDDPVGLRICRDNRAAIAAADIVHVIWDGKSQGGLFDLGMAFALGKPIAAVDVPAESEGKSFQNMMRAWARQGPQ
jgi:hypothetical protein